MTSVRKAFLTALFCLFLLPYSFDIGGDGVSGNYLFVFFPGLVIYFSKRIYLPSKDIRIIVILYALIFFAACIYQYWYVEFLDRRVVSFVLFMSIFLHMGIKIDHEMILCFKSAIFLVSILSIIFTISRYFSLGGADLGFGAKGVVGSQRNGFVYLMAIWIAFHYVPATRLLLLLKHVAILTLLAGLLLTYSRSTVVSIIGSLLIFLIAKASANMSLRNLLSRKSLVSSIFAVFVFFVPCLAISVLFPATVDFYLQNLFSLEKPSGDAVYDFVNPQASEGYRVWMATMIAEFVLQNPLTGSGYLGSWIMIDSLSGSAHNQYLDVFFRTGIIGFCCYLWLLYRLLRFLKFNEPSLFWGFVGVLIYGLFHETFKLSQGAFILSFLLGMMVQKRAGTVGAAQVQVRPASPSITVSQEVPPNRGMSAR